MESEGCFCCVEEFGSRGGGYCGAITKEQLIEYRNQLEADMKSVRDALEELYGDA